MALVALTGCGIGQKTIVGKWDCKFDGIKQEEGDSVTFEYLSDGTEIIRSTFSSKTNLQPVQSVGQWKLLDNNRYSSVIDGKTNITTFKFEGERLLFKAANSEEYSMKCDRVK